MGKLSQKDLLNNALYEEGIGSMLKAAAKAGLKTAVNTGKAIGAAAAPKTAAALGKLGQVISSNFVEILAANPKNGLRSWLNTPEGSRLFKDISLGKEKKIANNDVMIEFKGKYIDPKTPNEPKDVAGEFSVRPVSEGKWGVMGAKDAEGNAIWAPSKRQTGSAMGGKVGGGDKPFTGGIKESPISDDKTNKILEILKAGVERLPKAAEASYKTLRRLAIDGYKTGKYAANEIVSAADNFLTAVDEFQQGYDEGSREEPVEADREDPRGAQGAAGEPGRTDEVDAVEVDPDKIEGEPAPLKPSKRAGARGRKGPRGPKSDSKSAAARRIARALKSGRPPSRGDIEMLKKAGVKGRQKIGGVTLRNLARRTKLADSFSQKELLRQLTLLSH